MVSERILDAVHVAGIKLVSQHPPQSPHMRRCLTPRGVVALSTPNQRSILDAVAGALYHLSAGRIVSPLEKFYIDQHFLYFTPDSLGRALRLADLEVVQMERELTDLQRLNLSPPMRLVLELLFLLSRWSGRENRLFSIARAATLDSAVRAAL